jgi:hypothetical protein
MNEIPGISLIAKTTDNKQYVTPTSRPLGTTQCFTGTGDSTESSLTVWGGQRLYIRHSIGDSTVQEIPIHFNVIENDTFIKDGVVAFSGCEGDTLTMVAVPKTTSWTPQSNTFFDLYGGYLIVPAAGNGHINITEAPVLVSCPPSVDTGIRPPGFWDAPYDTVTHSFGDLTACPYGDGPYNMFGTKIYLNRYANELGLVGSGSMSFGSNDCQQIPHNVDFGLYGTTDGTADHNWSAFITLSMYRKNTTKE